MITLILITGWAAPQEPWTPLFNGKDFSGWERYVGPPADGKPPYGLDHDPEGVFTVVQIDGAPAVRVSGKIIGGFSTKAEFEDFHFRLEFKWGKETWPPRKDIARDSGILYYCIGEHGAGSGGWLKSVESNIMESDYGSFWSVAGTIVDIEIGEERLAYAEDPNSAFPVYRRGGRLMTAGLESGGVRPNPIVPERPGGWHTAEVISVRGDSIHIFDGRVTLVVRNARHKVGGKIVPLTKGRIQMQSEWAEVYYRKMEVRPVKEFPAELRDWVAIGPSGDEGFEPLLDEAHVKDWVMCGPGRFEVKDGVATGVGGMGLWWYRGKQYRDFILRGEYLKEPGGDSGVFLRFPDPGDDPLNAVKAGHEVEIGEDQPAKGSTGSIYPFQGPTWLPVRPDGQWNAYEIRCVGKTYEVSINGKLINRWVDTEDRPLQGHIGLQNYPYDKPVHHRRLRVKELAPR
jgi:hypothetical protein